MAVIVGKFPSIDNHYKSVGDMLGKQAVAVEKIDGSNFSVHISIDENGLPDYEFRSKNQKANEAEGSLFHEACQIALSKLERIEMFARPGLMHNIKNHPGLNTLPHDLEREVIFYFEVFGRGVQKRLPYTKYLEEIDEWYDDAVVNGRSIALIDVAFLPKEEGGKRTWCTIGEIRAIADFIGVWSPPVRWFNKLTLSHIENLLEEKGIEGFVVHTIDEKGRRLRNVYGDRMVVKVKTNEFCAYEKGGKNKERKAKPKTPVEIIDFLVDRIDYGRLHSVYSHGHDCLKREMADMKFLPDLVVEDIKAEDSSLWEKHDAKVIRKTVAKMLPQTLRGWLLEEQVK